MARADSSETIAEEIRQEQSGMRKAWKEYTRQVLPHAKAQLQNFMLACMAEGKTHADEDEEDQGHRRGTSLYCTLSIEEVRGALDFQAKKAMQTAEAAKNDHVDTTATNKRVMATAEMAIKLATETVHVGRNISNTPLRPVRMHCHLPKNLKRDPIKDASMAPTRASVDAQTHDWQQAYAEWYAKTYQSDDIVPNKQQTQVLEMIHETCVGEEAHKHLGEKRVTRAPLRHLVHGLPGSGKSELLLWIRSYFGEVWKWTYG